MLIYNSIFVYRFRGFRHAQDITVGKSQRKFNVAYKSLAMFLEMKNHGFGTDILFYTKNSISSHNIIGIKMYSISQLPYFIPRKIPTLNIGNFGGYLSAS